MYHMNHTVYLKLTQGHVFHISIKLKKKMPSIFRLSRQEVEWCDASLGAYPQEALYPQPLPSRDILRAHEEAWTRKLGDQRSWAESGPDSIRPQPSERPLWMLSLWWSLSCTATSYGAHSRLRPREVRCSQPQTLGDYFRALSFGVACFAEVKCWASYYLLLLPMLQVGKW